MKKAKKTETIVLSEMGARIKAERKARGWTQTQLAEATRMSQQWVAKIEKRGTREQEHIVKLAKALDRSPAYLQYGIEEIANLSERSLSLGLKINDLDEWKQDLVEQLVENLRKQKDK